MDWLRWYHGACTDMKWPVIAKKAKTKVGVVVSIWAALLEHTCQHETRGSIQGFDCEAVDVFFGYRIGTCEAVLSAMQDKGLIEDGKIVNWAWYEDK